MFWNTKREGYWKIVDILVGIVALVSLVLSFIEVFSMGYADGAIIDIFKNTKLKPVFSFGLSNGPVNPATELFSFGEWAGLAEGCDCRYASRKVKSSCRYQLCRESCSWNMTWHGCHKVPSAPEKNITYWHGSNIYADHFARNVSYQDYLENAVKKGQSCKPNYKPCGILDSLEQIMCLKTEEECPINDIKFSKDPIADPKYTSIRLKDQYYLHYSNQMINNKIIVNTQLVENKACIDPTQKDYNALHLLDYFFYDNMCSRMIGNYKYDERYMKLDVLNKRIVYEDNNILNYYRNDNRLDYSLFNPDLILYARNYIGLDRQCLIDSKFEEKKMDKDIESQNTGHGLDIAICVFVCIQLAMFSLFVFFRFKDEYDLETGSNMLIVLEIVCAFIIFILSLVAFLKFKSINMAFSCGDDITNTAMNNIQKLFDRAVIYNAFIMSSALLIMLLYPSDILLDCCLGGFASSATQKGKDEINYLNQDIPYIESDFDDKIQKPFIQSPTPEEKQVTTEIPTKIVDENEINNNNQDLPYNYNPQAPQYNYPQEVQIDYSKAPQNDYPQGPLNDYPQESQNNYPQEAQNNYPQGPQNDYPQGPQNDYPQEVQNNYPQEAQNNYPQEAQNNYPQPSQYNYPHVSPTIYDQFKNNNNNS